MGPWWHWAYFGFAAVLFGAYSVLHGRQNRKVLRALRAEFGQRRRRDLDEWFNEEWAVIGVSRYRVEEVLAPIARVLGCDISQLRPVDSFDGSLRWNGPSFIGIEDENPWDEYWDADLPALCGSDDCARRVQQQIANNPTLASLVREVKASG